MKGLLRLLKWNPSSYPTGWLMCPLVYLHFNSWSKFLELQMPFEWDSRSYLKPFRRGIAAYEEWKSKAMHQTMSDVKYMFINKTFWRLIIDEILRNFIHAIANNNQTVVVGFVSSWNRLKWIPEMYISGPQTIILHRLEVIFSFHLKERKPWMPIFCRWNHFGKVLNSTSLLEWIEEISLLERKLFRIREVLLWLRGCKNRNTESIAHVYC